MSESMNQSRYWYGGANSIVQVHSDGINVAARGALGANDARAMAVALLEAAAALESRGIVENVPPLPPNGKCEDCRGDRQEEGEGLILYNGLYGTFWACGHCHDIRTLEE